MKKIGVISDTHGMLREEIKEHLKDCDVILHGGDINRQRILDELEQIAPVYAVRGNNDKEWAEHLPDAVSLELYGLKIFMIHNKKQIGEDVSDRDIVIYGHSHKYEEKRTGGQLWLNPGSCGPRRFSQPVTMAVLEVEGERAYQVRKIEIAQKSPEGAKPENPQDMKRIIQSVMKAVDQGKTVEKIAQKNGISRELAEQICRLYLTHPGVDAEGIRNKMGI